MRIELGTERLVSASRGDLLTSNASTFQNIETAESQSDDALSQLMRARGRPALLELHEPKASVADYLEAFRRLEVQSRRRRTEKPSPLSSRTSCSRGARSRAIASRP